ncbi:unnamed protein product [Calypogeia fissa]
MEQSSGMYQMSVQQNIAPAPNEGSKVVDWLPKFAGFSWLAYGAHFSVVITMAPSPSNKGEVAMGGFFRQVLSTNWPKQDEEETQLVSNVAWAPRGLSIGSLAAAAGKHIYLYDPEGLNRAEEGNQDSPELPLRWVKNHVLDHFSDVQSFSWSESGDGLLAVGLEIVMWQKGENCWNCLWRSQLEQPQSLSAASWSARGIAATAEGPSVTQPEASDVDHLVKIWWWEDGKELLEVDLAHPHQLLMIQWRPSRSFRSSSHSFRPVLLTCCWDGVVRLWAEIGNLGFPQGGSTSLANVDTATIRDEVGTGYESPFKLAFFVSAVIDANSTLSGVLGQNIHITWPEGTGGGVMNSSSDGDESGGVVSKESDVAMNEWLVGIGPSGSVTLWSVQSLDDLSPARGPLIQLWQQRSGILSPPSVPSQGINVSVDVQTSPQAVRVVVHRPHGTFWGPPSSLDVVEIWSSSLLRWSSIWPPVAAVGGPTSKNIAANLGAANMIAAGGKMSTWGVSSELVVLGGHNGNITQIAVHPIAAVGLVASLDDEGAILLWDAQGSCSSLRSEITGCLNPLWRLSGQLTGHRVDCTGLFNSMAWAPLVLPRDETMLLLCHSHGVDCTLITRKVTVSRSRSKSFSISHSLLHTFEWPVSDDKYGLQGIYTLPSPSTVADDPYCKSCIAVGVGSNGSKLVSWKLEIQIRENRKDRQGSSQDLHGSDVREEQEVNDELSKSSEDVVSHYVYKVPDIEVQNVLLELCLLGILNVGTGEEVTSIATATSGHLLGCHSGNLSDFSEACDIVTGGADGVLRLWKVWDGSSVSSMLSLEKAGVWHCVGFLRCHVGRVSKVALCSGASKVASFGEEEPEVIHIWGADTFFEERGFCLEGRLRLSSPAVSFDWLDGGNGLPILGVKSQRDVHLFSECREQAWRPGRVSSSTEGDLWTCLALVPATGFSTSTLSWVAQGSLIVTFGAHVILYSNCVLPSASYNPASVNSEARQALTNGRGQASNARDISAYEATLARGDGTYIQSGVRLDKDEKTDQADQGPCSILEAAERIGCPLLDYHPTSLLSWIAGGSRQSARASIRHLASYLLALSSSSNLGVHKNVSEAEYEQPKPKVSRTPLAELFQGKEQLYSLQGQKPLPNFTEEGIGQSETQRVRGNVSPFSRASFADFAAAMSLGYKEEEQKSVIDPNSALKKGGLEPHTKVEVDIVSNAVRDSFMIPGLSTDEKLQLLAIIDMLSEMDGVGQSQIDGIDLPGQRFWLAFRYSVLSAKWKGDGSDTKALVMESKAMAWALQSEFKENLLSLCLPDQSLSWSVMRALGVGYWFTDGTELRKMMEKLARSQFLQKKDPKDCALLYLALGRRSVLAGLFKLSRDQKDRPITDFLLRDFKDEKHKTAALKNAYVLMGKHRHELAASFFILGGDVNSAAVICAKNLGDPQLALVISALLEGVNGPIGRDIILKYALPAARDTRDRWLASMLQWLLGKGIESVQELIESVQDHKRSNVSSQMDKGVLEGLKTPPAFPLDPDMGRYCKLLASKPRIRNSAQAAEACALAVIATTRSAAAMKKTGLLLHELEYLQGGRSINFDDSGSEVTLDVLNESTSNESTSPRSDFPVTDVSGGQVGSGWISREVASGIWKSTRFSSVLQCTSLFLQDHPHWGGQDPVISGIMSKQFANVRKIGSSLSQNDEGTILDRPAKQFDLSSHLEAADRGFNEDLQFLKKNYSIEVAGVVGALTTFSRIHHRPYLLHRLVNGLWNYTNAPDLGFHLASQAAMSMSVAQFLEGFGTDAPRVLAWTILSCGGAAAAQLCNLETSQRQDRETSLKKDVANKGGALPTFSFEELVRFGREIQLLTKAANHEQSHYGKERGTRALSLLSFIFFVAAAWLGRQTKALLNLIAPTVIDPSTAPEVPEGEYDAILWFRRLGLEERALYGHRPGKKPMEPVGFNMAGTVTIPGDDAWRVLGVCLWNHLLIYVRKQLTGIASEASYSGFGRVSSSQSQSTMKQSIHGITSQPQASASNVKGATFLGFNLQTSTLSSTWLDFKSKVRESYQTVPVGDDIGVGELGASLGKLPVSDGNSSSTADTDDFDVALLGALTSVVAGLRKQLAAHLEHSLDKSEADPLTLWLWGKPPKPSATMSTKTFTGGSSLNFFNASSSNGQVGVSATKTVNVYSQSQPNLYPTGVIGMEEKECQDLWELLVVREKVCSALGLEGVSGQRRKQENDNMSVWYSGRNGQVPATSGDVGRGVNTSCRIPPKRIMWNAVKGVSSSVSDPGVILSSRREEQKSQSRSRAPEDGLHLSEEFSEWVDLRGHFRYPIPF